MPKIKKVSKSKDVFTVIFSGSATMEKDWIWPDGGAPENPTVEDVVRAIKDDTYDTADFIQDWNLADDIEIHIYNKADPAGLDVDWTKK